MNRKLIAVLPVLEESLLNRLQEAAETHGFEFFFFHTDEEAFSEAADAEIILGQSPELARQAKKLRWLCTPSAGIDQFTAPGVFASPDAVLSNSSGAYGVTIAEHTVMMILQMLRRQQEYASLIQQRCWIRNLPVKSVRGARITLLGTGDIGTETAIRLRSFHPAQLIGVNRSGKNPGRLYDRILTQDRMEEILPETGILIISLPGTQETRQMLTREKLSLLPEGALVVNVGRGSVIDQEALEAELRSGRLYAALDVFEQEPIPVGSSLWTCPNLLITPHVAGNMTLPYTREKIVSLFLEDLENYCSGRPLKRQTDPARGY